MPAPTTHRPALPLSMLPRPPSIARTGAVIRTGSAFDTVSCPPRPDPVSRPHGDSLLAAQDASIQPLLEPLAALTNGHDDVRLQTAGRIAGRWFAATVG